MKKGIKSQGIIACIIVLIVALGFFREFIFVNLNFQLGKLYYLEFYHTTDYEYQLPPSLSILGSYSYMQLYWIKWFLTGAFTIIYFLVTVYTLKRIFPQMPWRNRIITGLYAALFIVALLCYLYGFLPGRGEQGYSLALDFMHILQSPMPLMILVPAFKLMEIGRQQKDAT